MNPTKTDSIIGELEKGHTYIISVEDVGSQQATEIANGAQCTIILAPRGTEIKDVTEFLETTIAEEEKRGLIQFSMILTKLESAADEPTRLKLLNEFRRNISLRLEGLSPLKELN